MFIYYHMHNLLLPQMRVGKTTRVRKLKLKLKDVTDVIKNEEFQTNPSLLEVFPCLWLSRQKSMIFSANFS